MNIELAIRSIIDGIRIHVKGNGFEKVVIGVSGGIDSALVATLAQMALGADNVHCLLMPSTYSSPDSQRLGAQLANNLGCQCELAPISLILDKYKWVLTVVLGDIERSLTEENLQARIRGNILMAYANHNHTLVLATGNKSESMVGYCTLYGDTVGSLEPIANLYKTEVYAVAKYLNREKEIIPIEIIEREPSAELSPGQKDTDALPPYEVLDAILDGYESNLQINELAEYASCSTTIVTDVVDRIKKNKFKTLQCPPAIIWSK